MIKITTSQEKLTPAKKNIKLDGIFVKDLKFVDETGDITQQVIDELPDGTSQVGLKSLLNCLRKMKIMNKGGV